MIVMVAGVAYLMSQDGSYSKKTTSSDGKEVYQSVPPPQGAIIKTLPATRVLVTVSGTTYYLSANAFYRRVMAGNQETWVTVTPPAGVVCSQCKTSVAPGSRLLRPPPPTIQARTYARPCVCVCSLRAQWLPCTSAHCAPM